MTQINYPFGDTLEFSCTVTDGEISAQELVTSGSDAIVSFKLDNNNFLDPDELESIAGQIRQAQTGGRLGRATDDEADVFVAAAKNFLKDHPVLSGAAPGVVYALAEQNANKEGLTMYDDAVTALAPSAPASFPFEEDDLEDEDDEEDSDDEDDYCDDYAEDHEYDETW